MKLVAAVRRHHRITATLLTALLGCIAAYVLAVWPQSTAYGPVTSSGPSERPLIALTFDDGPNDPATSRILDVLRQYQVRATFFVVGHNAGVFPQTLRRMAAEGHMIGNHSYHHQKRYALLDPEYDDVTMTQDAIREIAGVTPTVYRSPNGFHTPWQLAAVRRAGLITVHWNVQTLDWERPAPPVIAQRVFDHAKPGAIVLLHDGDDTRSGVDRTPTVEALPLIIEGLRARGYQLVTVGELLGIPDHRN